MPARHLTIVGFALLAVGMATQVSAEILCETFNSIARDVKRRQCWPDPFEGPDRAAVRAPFAIQVANGWRKQNMLGEYHFEPRTGQLTEAGHKKVRWILISGPRQHRDIYVHIGESNEETAARLAAVQQYASEISPEEMPRIAATSIPDDGWPADRVDMIERKYQSSMPDPRLPASTNSGMGSGSSQ